LRGLRLYQAVLADAWSDRSRLSLPARQHCRAGSPRIVASAP